MIIKAPINLKLTQYSGQTSQPPWIEIEDSFRDMVFVNDTPVIFKVKESDNGFDFSFKGDVSQKQAENKISEIYDLNFNLNKFYRYLNNQPELENVSGFCEGLRLFEAKDQFECIISSICSANNSIKRWTKSINEMKKRWGVEYDGCYAFPNPNTLKSICLDDEDELLKCGCVNDNNLKSCGVGYRAEYMREASNIFNLEMELSDFKSMSYEEAFDEIIKVPGVGPKVADCILLYGFGFRQAFPSDVWIKRIISYLYFDGKDISVKKVRDFGMDEFGDNAGYVQLYLFHYARKSGLMEKLKPKKG